MEYRKFGSAEFEISPMGLGCMRMSGPSGPVDDAESIATLHMAFDLGINFLDTSANYGRGHLKTSILLFQKRGTEKAKEAEVMVAARKSQSAPE